MNIIQKKAIKYLQVDIASIKNYKPIENYFKYDFFVSA